MRLALLNSEAARQPPLAPPDGIELEFFPLRVPGFARNPYDHLFVEIAHIDAAERAEVAGCDGIFIDTFADYGIDRIRHTVAIPVFGAGEVGIAAASAGERRFSIVTVWPESLAFIYRERLIACAGGHLCAGVHYFSAETELELLNTDAGIAQRMVAREGSLVDQLAQACRRAVDEDGSEAVLCGCTCMSPIGELLAERCVFPVVECSRVGQAAAMDGLLSGSRAAERALSARRGDVRRMVDSMLGESDGLQMPQDTCDVCVTLDDAAHDTARDLLTR
jgi:allantoin racemase